MDNAVIEKFKNREYKAKEVFEIREIDKSIAYAFVRKYHYLGDAKFFAVYSYGLYAKQNGEFCGCATYSLPQGKDTAFGWFGLPADSPDVLELSRLCLLPELNGTNATSFLLGNSIKMLKQKHVKAVITLADSSRHVGSIYQVCNFTYYGLTAPKCDFIADNGLINQRGKVHNKAGVWLERTRKHRYAYILDKTLTCKYTEQPHPKANELLIPSCCDDKFVVEDKRNHKYYTCPKCTIKMMEINKSTFDDILEKADAMSTEDLLRFINDYIKENYHDDNSLFDMIF